MIREQPNWDHPEPDEWTSSGLETDDTWPCENLDSASFEDTVRDAFELDDSKEPEPEYGDFWPETEDRNLD